MSSMPSSALNQNLRGIIDFPQKLSGWADNKEQEAIIEEKVNEALAARNEEEES